MEEHYTQGGECRHIKGVKCNVHTCYYHENDCDCTAHEVAVGSVGSTACADCSSDTLCATFKPREKN